MMTDAVGTIMGLRKNDLNLLFHGSFCSMTTASSRDRETARGTATRENFRVFKAASLKALLLKTLT
jgi:hypothetical protein